MHHYLSNIIDRAVKSAAQAAILALGADTVDLISTDWVGIGSLAAGGAILSVLTSLATAGIKGDVQIVGRTTTSIDPDGHDEDLL